MRSTKERFFVLIGSLTLTALLVGTLGGAGLVWRVLDQRIQDPEFLQEQLARVSPEDQVKSGPPPALVRVSLAQRKPIQPEKPLIGRLVEVRRVTVASEVTGKILDLPVEEGTAVVGGQTQLAQVDDVWARLGVAQARAAAASTKAQLEFERNEYQRVAQLVEQNASSRSELEAKAARVEELQARLEETQMQIEEHSERLARSAIVAPFDGTVVTKHAELGGHVTPGAPIVEIVSRGEVDARIMVPEAVINRIRVGQEIPIRIDPLGVQVPGRVVSVTPFGPTASRTFPVRVRLKDQEGRLMVGMSVTAIVETGPVREALVVSRDAVLVRPDGATVWVAHETDAEQHTAVYPVPVTLSIQTAGEYAVEPEDPDDAQLLVPGARVVIEGAERLTAGQQVRIVTLEETLGLVE